MNTKRKLLVHRRNRNIWETETLVAIPQLNTKTSYSNWRHAGSAPHPTAPSQKIANLRKLNSPRCKRKTTLSSRSQNWLRSRVHTENKMTTRLCDNYRELNTISEQAFHILLSMGEYIISFNDAAFFSPLNVLRQLEARNRQRKLS